MLHCVWFGGRARENQREVVSRLGFLTDEAYKEFIAPTTEVSKMIERLIRSLNSKSYPFNSRSSFTIVELIVAVGLFAIIVVVASGGFARALRTQRQVAAILAANSNASLVLEQMMREMRTGRSFGVSGGTCSRGNVCGNSLRFTNDHNDEVEYHLNGDKGSIERKCLQDDPPKSCHEGTLTSDKVVVKKLSFILLDWGGNDTCPPRITILLSVSPKRGGVAENVLNLQTTVSGRHGC